MRYGPFLLQTSHPVSDFLPPPHPRLHNPNIWWFVITQPQRMYLHFETQNLAEW